MTNRLKWEPQVITFITKSKKKDKNPMKDWRDKVEKYDVKTIEAFVPGQTKYVCADKRNTSKGLQALVNGAYIVLNTYVDAIFAVCHREDPEALASSEIDFDNKWPKPLQYLPPAGSEPVHRPAQVFAPDTRRHTLMEGFTIITTTSSQYHNLMSVITDAGGKIDLFEVEPYKSDPNDLIKVANKLKKRVVVRPVLLEAQEWCTQFCTEVSQKCVRLS